MRSGGASAKIPFETPILGDGTATEPGERRPRPVPVYGLGEADLPADCEVGWAVISQGQGHGTITTDPGLIVDANCSTPCSAPFTVDSLVTITVTPELGSTFGGWHGDCSGNNTTTQVTMDFSRNCFTRFNINPDVGEPPQASFIANPNPAQVNEMVLFDATGSTDDGVIVSYEWDFENDGTFGATGAEVQREFTTAGAFDVRLLVTDDDGFTAETIQVLHVGNLPLAQFSFDPAQPATGRTVQFDASASTTGNGTLVSYSWDFENDGTVDATGVAPTHVFPTAGTFRVRLRVVDSIGLAGAITQEIVVSGVPTAAFTATPSPATVGQSVTFDGSGSMDDGTITTYEWDFEDDGTVDTTGQIVNHTYGSAGTFTIHLRVTDDVGLTGETTQQLVVNTGGGGNPTLIVVPQGGGSGNVVDTHSALSCTFTGPTSTPDPCTLTVNPGDTVTLIPFPATAGGSVFSHWGVGDCDQEVPGDPDSLCRVTLNGDRTVNVFFE